MIGSKMRWLMLLLLGMQLPQLAVAQRKFPTEKSAIRDGFLFATGEPIRIAVFPPDSEVSETNAAGMALPDAKATDAARVALIQSLQTDPSFPHAKWVVIEPKAAEALPALASQRALFQLVVDAAIRHRLFATEPLPSKQGQFQWSLGKGMSDYIAQTNATYGLFIYTRDSRNSAGKTAMQALATALGNRAERGKHMGYAGLVDLKSGELVWLNVNLKMSPDLETGAGANLRLKQLLRGFPAPNSGQGK